MMPSNHGIMPVSRTRLKIDNNNNYVYWLHLFSTILKVFVSDFVISRIFVVF